MRRILFLVNDAAFFLSHRLPLAIAARGSGLEVHVATPPSLEKEIKDLGFFFHPVPLSRSGGNPLRELFSIYKIFTIFRAVRPDLVHLVTIKPVLYGGIAARLAGVGAVVSAISGLGFVFMAEGRRSNLLKVVVSVLYRVALNMNNLRVIFQNPDDRDALIRLGILKADKAVLIRGSGVSLDKCHYLPELDGVPVVVMAARLLRDKGVKEFVAAAELLSRQGVKARFVLAGDTDSGNPTSLTAVDLEEIKAAGYVEVVGYQSDIPALFSSAHIVVLPSYREGLPKVLIEAAACGRAVVTTDVPGCRDAIEVGRTGLLVPVGDAQALAAAFRELIEDPDKRKNMGAAGRRLAEEEFGIERIIDKHMEIYRQLLERTA